MKKKWIAGLVMGLVACSAWAADGEGGKKLTAEQQQQRSALIQKYDANKDGTLDKKESKQMSKADKKALAKLGGVGTAKKSGEAEKGSAREKARKTKEEKKAAEAKAETAGKNVEKTGKDSVKSTKSKTAK
jgi:hypothetical protein